MAIGDDAIAAGMANVNGAVVQANTLDTEIMLTRDYIAQRTSAVTPITKGGTGATTVAGARNALGLGNTSGAVPVANGGTGATSASSARTNLDVPRAGTAGGRAVMDVAGDGNVGLRFGGSRFVGRSGSTELELANLLDAQAASGAADAANNNANGRVAKSGDTMSGHLYLPASSAASSGYTIAYINGDGRVSRGASSARYKTDIDRAPELPDIFAAPIASYVMKEDPDQVRRYGPVAEDLAADPRTAGFVIHDSEGRPESFDMISYLMAAVAQLNARVAALESAR
jgi:hypothetical protein